MDDVSGTTPAIGRFPLLCNGILEIVIGPNQHEYGNESCNQIIIN